jgi:hypothetical protein
MFVRHQLLTLPLHRHSAETYYKLHDRFLSKRRPELEKQWGRPFDELPQYVRLSWKDQNYWPPWQFNDLCGFLVVGTDEGFSLAGDVYLRRKHFPLTAPERFNRKNEGHRERNHILFFSSTAKHNVERDRRDSYLEAARKIVSEAEATVRTRSRGATSAQVTLQGFDLSCLHLADAHSLARESST